MCGCERRENPLQWQDGSVPSGKPIPEETRRAGWEGEDQQKAGLRLLLKELVRNLLSNNCLQKCKTGAKEAEESQKTVQKDRETAEKVLPEEVNKILWKRNDPSFECKCYVKPEAP